MSNCAGFLKAQTRSDFEVIFVVDARSTDGSVDLAHELSLSFGHSSVIVQSEGLGLGGNRNLGLDRALGECVWFADVDDAPSPDFIKDMLSLYDETHADFVCCNFVNTGPEGLVKEKPGAKYGTKILNRDEALISRTDGEFPVSTWSKLFNREFLLKNGLYFDESFAEDIYHTYRCLDRCDKICIYDRPLYAYRQTKDSICRNKAHQDKRGRDEIASYDRVDGLTDDVYVLKRNALMKIRSSGHMSYTGFMEYAKSEKNRESYEKYLKGTPEGWWHLHFSTLYWIAIRFYVATVYKRNGSLAMKKFR